MFIRLEAQVWAGNWDTQKKTIIIYVLNDWAKRYLTGNLQFVLNMLFTKSD